MAADRLPPTDGATVLTVLEEGIYLERCLLPIVSLAYDGLLKTIGRSGIESITFHHPVATSDMRRLAAHLGGRAGQEAPGGTVRLNEASWSWAQLVRGPASPLRGAYASSLDVLRSLSQGTTIYQQFPLPTLAAEVQSLLDLSVRQPVAALLLSTMKSHHEYTLYHSVNVCLLALALGRAAGMEERDLVLLGMGGLLHDIGKLALPASLLDTPGQLSWEQWEEIRRHPQLGAQVILTASEPGQEAIAAVALEHHTGYDGRGYPRLEGRSPGAGTDCTPSPTSWRWPMPTTRSRPSAPTDGPKSPPAPSRHSSTAPARRSTPKSSPPSSMSWGSTRRALCCASRAVRSSW